MKRVTVAIQVDSSFVRMLRAQIGLSGGMQPDRQLTPSEVLARLVLAEAMGGLETQVDLIVPPEWRASICAVHEARAVEEVPG